MQTDITPVEKSDADKAKVVPRSTHPCRWVDEDELREVYKVPYGRSRLYELEKAGKFPKRVKLGTGPNGKARWRAAEIEAHGNGTWKPADAPAAPARETVAA